LTVAIIGRGLIGTSVGLAVRRAAPDVRLIELDKGDPLDAIAGAELVVLATPVDVILDLVRDHTSSFGDAVVLDTGSTKGAIVAAAREAAVRNFIGGHPIAGAAASGPSAARADLFDGKPWFLIPAFGQGTALDRARTFVEKLGAVPVIQHDEGRDHDRVMAAVSHLPQVTASALMCVVGEAVDRLGLVWAGSGLRDTTRLAQSSATIWESILATNAAELEPLMTALADRLREIAGQLKNPDAVRRLFSEANRWRDEL